MSDTNEQPSAGSSSTVANVMEPALLIRLTDSYRPGMSDVALYEATRGVWRIGPRREGARLALAVHDGLVKEVYQNPRVASRDNDALHHAPLHGSSRQDAVGIHGSRGARGGSWSLHRQVGRRPLSERQPESSTVRQHSRLTWRADIEDGDAARRRALSTGDSS